ncbi:hypothetical protein Q3G72_028830 [Acer saccharum]|nr:hypothetical protein Q3G72_028830 [Acer saccharum]
MTPIASQEPSRTATPIRATTPAARSPITPVRCQQGLQGNESYQTGLPSTESRGEVGTRRYGDESNACKIAENNDSDQARKLSNLESQAIAWDVLNTWQVMQKLLESATCMEMEFFQTISAEPNEKEFSIVID